jgi:RNA polymerase sigma factor (sigma-70 family)
MVHNTRHAGQRDPARSSHNPRGGLPPMPLIETIAVERHNVNGSCFMSLGEPQIMVHPYIDTLFLSPTWQFEKIISFGPRNACSILSSSRAFECGPSGANRVLPQTGLCRTNGLQACIPPARAGRVTTRRRPMAVLKLMSDDELVENAKGFIRDRGITTRTKFMRAYSTLYDLLFEKGLVKKTGLPYYIRRMEEGDRPTPAQQDYRDAGAVNWAEELLPPFIRPEDYTADEIERYREDLRSFSQLMPGTASLNRKNILETLLSWGIEPVDMRQTELGELIPNLLPLRTIESAWEMSLENIGLAHAAAGRNSVSYVSYDDKVQFFTLQLFDTALYWDSSQSTFSTYFFSKALKTRRDLYAFRDLVRIPPHRLPLISKLRRLQRQNPLSSRYSIGCEMDLDRSELDMLQMDSDLLSNLLRYLTLDKVFNGLTPDRLRMDLDEMLVPVPTCSIPDEILLDMQPDQEEKLISAELIQKIMSAMDSLSDRQREFILRYYGIGRESEILESISRTEGISRERVRQIKAKGVEKLQKLLEKELREEIRGNEKPSTP